MSNGHTKAPALGEKISASQCADRTTPDNRGDQSTELHRRPEKTYIGERIKGVTYVNVNGRPLAERFDLRCHSPTGFEWGYGGSGPAQLALAILADHLGDDRRAMELYQDFKARVIAGIAVDRWRMTSSMIDALLSPPIPASIAKEGA